MAVLEELILMHAVLEMGIGSDASSLRRFASVFVESVERWRARAKDISEGKEVAPTREMMRMPGKGPGPMIPPSSSPHPASSGGGKPSFIKI